MATVSRRTWPSETSRWKRGPLHLVDRERGEQQGVAAQRLAVDGQHRAAVGLDGPGQLGHLRPRDDEAQVGGAELVGFSFTPVACGGVRTW